MAGVSWWSPNPVLSWWSPGGSFHRLITVLCTPKPYSNYSDAYIGVYMSIHAHAYLGLWFERGRHALTTAYA